MDGYFGLVEAKTDYKKKDSVKTHKDLLQLCLFGVNALEQYGTICILLMQVIDPSVYAYGCFNRVEGAVVVMKLKEFKLLMSMKGLPGYIMCLDELKKVAHFYQF
ncbi:uncharacterized protein RHIMIDRAFT_260740 [Rhizopus microsporus ATCC 52813]|uniref:Uncharacterized protein n=1 Tax=Rhizopus microsporus ATCC 52813 TaxID=1340429 RepID=A0A2G4SNT4_RHIZD|nr:uncharacterized protein RHIMIDRAFT_260740 [Rhizopus microsporus ATCC 52813]PHZ10402.1 hypothetical protein RHIMIDRAFT_260740 [Rhizopus microsporus ATCC 52813]